MIFSTLDIIEWNDLDAFLRNIIKGLQMLSVK